MLTDAIDTNVLFVISKYPSPEKGPVFSTSLMSIRISSFSLSFSLSTSSSCSPAVRYPRALKAASRMNEKPLMFKVKLITIIRFAKIIAVLSMPPKFLGENAIKDKKMIKICEILNQIPSKFYFFWVQQIPTVTAP